MQVFEYKFVTVNITDGTGDKTLTELGGQGWKVVDSRPHPEHRYLSVVLLEASRQMLVARDGTVHQRVARLAR